MLYGYSQVIIQGTLVTLELAISSVLLAVIIGLIGAGGKLSKNRLISGFFGCYTTLIRGVPDLVLMLLIFYGLQIVLNSITESLCMAQIDIDPLGAGIITLGFIYGAYFTETFRGVYGRSSRANRSGYRLRFHWRANFPPHSFPSHDALCLTRHRQ